MTGDTAQDRFYTGAYGHAVALVGQLVQDIQNHRPRIALAKDRRGLAHRHRAAAERLDHQAQPRQFIRQFQQTRGVAFGHLDDLGDQQRLRRNAVFRHLAFKLLVNQPLMRRMGIDDHHAVGGLRQDVILMQMRARRAERQVLRRGLLGLRRVFDHRLDPCAVFLRHLGETGRLCTIGHRPRRA